MIKVTLGEQPDFPKFMIHTDGTVMFFKAEGVGMCLVSGGKTPVGHMTNCMSMAGFQDLAKPITLQNA